MDIGTILNYIGQGFALLIGGLMALFGSNDYKQKNLLRTCDIVLAVIIWYYTDWPFPYALLLAVIFEGAVIINLFKIKPIEGSWTAEEEKREKEKAEQYAKEHPYKSHVIQSQESNNSPSLASYFEHQQKATNEFMQKRLQTMADIRAGQAPNGTDGVWQ